MARAFAAGERDQIRAALMAAGRKRFGQAGVRAVRVDDLCQDVGIAKGSFYGFFPSKEDLFMTIANEQDLMHKRGVMGVLKATEGTAAEVTGALFDQLMDRVETDPIFAIVRDGSELQSLMRKVSPDLLQENAKADRLFLGEVSDLLTRRFPDMDTDAELLERLMTLMLTLSMQKNIIQEVAHYQGTVALLRSLFVDRLAGAGRDDFFLFMADLTEGART